MIENRTELNFSAELDKSTAINTVDKWRFEQGFLADEINGEKPWGAYWRVPDSQIRHFVERFFPQLSQDLKMFELNLSPKLLLVEPNQQLSWQYHERRAENWVVVAGNLGIKMSATNEEPEKMKPFKRGQSVRLENGTRHRLISTGEWGLVAEIWTHSDSDNPSDEEDIKRLADGYGREGSTSRY